MDSGYLKLLNVHGSRSTDAAEDPDLKAEFIAGHHAIDIFHLVRPLFARLMDYSTNIQKPLCVEMDTKEALGDEEGDSEFDRWVSSKFVAVESARQGSSVPNVKSIFMNYFGVKKQQVEVPMREHGFICKTGSGFTYVLYQFPCTSESVPIKIKTVPVAESAIGSALQGTASSS